MKEELHEGHDQWEEVMSNLKNKQSVDMGNSSIFYLT